MDSLKFFEDYQCTCPDFDKYTFTHDGNVCHCHSHGKDWTNHLTLDCMEKDHVYHLSS